MTWILLLVSGCATGPSGPADRAGCALTEARYSVWQPEPWSIVEQRWDASGHLEYQHRTINPSSSSARHEEKTWTWEGDRLLDESSIAWEEPGAPDWAYHSTHTYDAAGLRVSTVEWSDPDAPFGTWAWEHDRAGNPAGGTWDAGDDGEIDGLRVEVWAKQPFGWRVDTTQDLDGEPPMFEERELDEALRELWRSEDWDGDGVSEVVEQHRYDDAGRVVSWDLGGATMIDESCTYTWVGDERATARCADDVHDGWFDWVWVGLEGRPRRAVVNHVRDDGVTEAWEEVTYTWDCP